KANFLFELKDAFLDKNNHSSWVPFFIDAITSYLLEDETSPGEIDDSEAQWLRAKIQYDGKLGKIDRALLANLKSKSINYPEILHLKNKSVLFFEAILFSTRFVTFLAVLGSLLAAVALFIVSTLQVVKGLIFFVDIMKGVSEDLEHLVAIFVSSVDGYLFATVLLIFSMGTYELFINKIDVVSKQKDSRPNWLIINSIDDLKSSLGKVILMILIVSFFEHSLNIKYENISDLLFLGIGILLIAVALFLTHAHGKHKEKNIKE
ncbi:MAG: YqhA family protein, partial [Dysgonamonadaceae bacterium]|nr:YqhA family protein [Dysgonamonadaceae bacterium]